MKMNVLNLLGILFIGLKLTGFIDWNWFFVTSPFIVNLALLFTISFFRLDKTQAERDKEDVLYLMKKLRNSKK
jgi:hypothetical protein